MTENPINDYECDWSSEEGQKIIKEVSDRINELKSEGQLVDDKRYEELKERMKALLKVHRV